LACRRRKGRIRMSKSDHDHSENVEFFPPK
jgi:hypothetical protein